MEEETLLIIEHKLDVIIKILASKSIEGKSNKTDAILLLNTMGLDSSLISDIVDTTPNVVRARLAEAKKKKLTSPSKRSKKYG